MEQHVRLEGQQEVEGLVEKESEGRLRSKACWNL